MRQALSCAAMILGLVLLSPGWAGLGASWDGGERCPQGWNKLIFKVPFNPCCAFAAAQAGLF